MTQLRFLTGLSQPCASNQMKALREYGLVVYRRENMEVIYRLEANEAVMFAPEVLDALRDCFEKSTSVATLIRHATAFTHERRIEILRALRGRALSVPALRDATGMSSSALCRHLDKLVRRGYVKESERVCRIGGAGNPLGRTLLQLAVR